MDGREAQNPCDGRPIKQHGRGVGIGRRGQHLRQIVYADAYLRQRRTAGQGDGDEGGGGQLRDDRCLRLHLVDGGRRTKAEKTRLLPAAAIAVRAAGGDQRKICPIDGLLRIGQFDLKGAGVGDKAQTRAGTALIHRPHPIADIAGLGRHAFKAAVDCAVQ